MELWDLVVSGSYPFKAADTALRDPNFSDAGCLRPARAHHHSDPAVAPVAVAGGRWPQIWFKGFLHDCWQALPTRIDRRA